MSWGTVSSEAIVPRHPESLTGSPAGSGLLDAPASAAALAVAREVGARVADPARVAEAVAAAARQTAHPASAHWRDHAVGQGHAGLACCSAPSTATTRARAGTGPPTST